MKWRLLATSLFLACVGGMLSATELAPWFGKTLEIEGRATTRVQCYNLLDTKSGSKKHPACDVFVDLSAATAVDLIVNVSAELEAVLAATRHRSFGFDSFLFTGRYLWLNDVIGDPISLVTGATISKVFRPARHDIGVFHHGGIQCEFHVAAGKEFSCEQFWLSRGWGVLGLGIADQGSPWLRANLAWERNWWNRHELKIFMDSLWGLGNRSLNLKHHFPGYGPIHHQSIDTGVRYRIAFESGAALSFEYAYRLFANNCPEYVNLLMVRLFYPFGL